MPNSYTFDSRNGQFRNNNVLIGWGYSGFGRGLLNPSEEFTVNVGPVPRGRYTLELINFPTEGPIVFNMKPVDPAKMGVRSGIHMHWDNRSHNFTASKGCIIVMTTWLFSIFKHGDEIEVIAL